jgi:hypothetical protein
MCAAHPAWLLLLLMLLLLLLLLSPRSATECCGAGDVKEKHRKDAATLRRKQCPSRRSLCSQLDSASS